MKPLKSDAIGSTTTVVGRWASGFTWMAHPKTMMRRASHAIVIDGDVWLVDPLDAEGLDAALSELGQVAGVVVMTNSHGRHADRLATRHDVAIHVPHCFDTEAHPVDGFRAPVRSIDEELSDTGFELAWEKDGRSWKEGALYHPERQTLVIPDTLMTALFTGREGRLEVLPFFRFSPLDEAFSGLGIERILVGHGAPVLEDAQNALSAALDGAGGSAPTAIVRSLPTMARQVLSELRS